MDTFEFYLMVGLLFYFGLLLIAEYDDWKRRKE